MKTQTGRLHTKKRANTLTRSTSDSALTARHGMFGGHCSKVLLYDHGAVNGLRHEAVTPGVLLTAVLRVRYLLPQQKRLSQADRVRRVIEAGTDRLADERA